ncbi:RhoGAP domain-containing protein [Yersinia artesiana]|uniref:RhoGAP domain-containing protein n=1 Tax=Yersinia artesiana TaxID=2890315 RepID=UPI001582EB23|nr:RhoGAP domain-containing protein [Yersinia artesiana]
MSINFFTSAKSVSKYLNQKNPTLDNVTKAEVLLKSKIASVLSDIKHYEQAYKDTPLFIGSKKSNDTNYEHEQLLVNKLIQVVSNDTTAKNPVSEKNISKLSKQLAKYRSQDLQLKNCKDIIENQKPGSAENILIAQQQCALNGMTLLSNYIKTNPDHYKAVGVFRKAGTLSEVREIIKKINQNTTQEEINTITEERTPHTLFSAIKKLYHAACSDSDSAKLIELSKQYNITKQLPSTTELPSPLQQLLPLLATVNQYEDDNSMNAQALATCFNFDYFSADNQSLTLENINVKLHLPSENSITSLVIALIQDEKLKLFPSEINPVENVPNSQPIYINAGFVETPEPIYAEIGESTVTTNENVKSNTGYTYAKIEKNINPVYDTISGTPRPVEGNKNNESKPSFPPKPQYNTTPLGQNVERKKSVKEMAKEYDNKTRPNSV